MSGRPKKFNSVDELEILFDEYFNNTPREEWTMTGLCIACDMDYQTLINYSKKDEYFEPIKKAKMKVHNEYEKDLRRKGRSGDIFALKNFGWRDRQEIDSKVEHKNNPIDSLVKSIEEQKNADN